MHLRSENKTKAYLSAILLWCIASACKNLLDNKQRDNWKGWHWEALRHQKPSKRLSFLGLCLFYDVCFSLCWDVDFKYTVVLQIRVNKIIHYTSSIMTAKKYNTLVVKQRNPGKGFVPSHNLKRFIMNELP